MSWKRISKNVRSDYGKRYRTDAFEIADVGCLIQTTVERVEPGGTSVGISSVFVAGIKIVEVAPGEHTLKSRWPLDDEFSQAAIGGQCVDLPPVTNVELTGDAQPPAEEVLPPTEDVTALPSVAEVPPAIEPAAPAEVETLKATGRKSPKAS